MKPIERKKVENSLQKKGFEKHHSDHRKFIYHTLKGKKTSVWTKTSHGSSHSEISKENLAKMAKQCRLNNNDFSELVECPIEQDHYEQMLVQNGDIVQD